MMWNKTGFHSRGPGISSHFNSPEADAAYTQPGSLRRLGQQKTRPPFRTPGRRVEEWVPGGEVGVEEDEFTINSQRDLTKL